MVNITMPTTAWAYAVEVINRRKSYETYSQLFLLFVHSPEKDISTQLVSNDGLKKLTELVGPPNKTAD